MHIFTIIFLKKTKLLHVLGLTGPSPATTFSVAVYNRVPS